MSRRRALAAAVCTVALAVAAAAPTAAADEAARLVAAMLSDTPLVGDLRQLTDTVGGRATGSTANERAVQWALEKLRAAGVAARAEPFEMPQGWLEAAALAVVEGDGVRFVPRVAARPFSVATPAGGLTAPLLDAGRGTEEEFARLGDAARGAFVLVATPLLEDVPGLFQEYMEASAIEERAVAAGVRGMVFMGSRPGNELYRHNAARGPKNALPLAVMERDAASRARRLLAAGVPLTLTLDLRLYSSGAYTAHNVIGEIRGRERPEEVVLIGAHLDSWELGTGALDNGCNVALVIDVARQMQRLGLTPKRTIRFALWNGEEQGLYGSWGYVKAHADELGGHVMAASFDIGSGRIDGFLTGARGKEIGAVLDAALAPVAGLGPFQHQDAAIYGTDHFDFLLQGVVGLVAHQESANYGPHYHARSDTFDRVDLEQVKLNSAIAAAVAWGFANAEVSWGRLDRAAVEALVDPELEAQMKAFGVWDDWAQGRRGRQAE